MFHNNVLNDFNRTEWRRKKQNARKQTRWFGIGATVQNAQSSKLYCHVLNQIEAIKLEILLYTKIGCHLWFACYKKINKAASKPPRARKNPFTSIDGWLRTCYISNWVILNSIFDRVCLEYLFSACITHSHTNNNHMKYADWQHRHLVLVFIPSFFHTRFD